MMLLLSYEIMLIICCIVSTWFDPRLGHFLGSDGSCCCHLGTTCLFGGTPHFDIPLRGAPWSASGVMGAQKSNNSNKDNNSKGTPLIPKNPHVYVKSLAMDVL